MCVLACAADCTSASTNTRVKRAALFTNRKCPDADHTPRGAQIAPVDDDDNARH